MMAAAVAHFGACKSLCVLCGKPIFRSCALFVEWSNKHCNLPMESNCFIPRSVFHRNCSMVLHWSHLQPNFKESVRKAASFGCRGPKAVVICSSGMNLVFVSAEVAPWIKTGRLGDIVGGLIPALAVKPILHHLKSVVKMLISAAFASLDYMDHLVEPRNNILYLLACPWTFGYHNVSML